MSNCMCMALRPAKRTQYFNVKSHNIGKTVKCNTRAEEPKTHLSLCHRLSTNSACPVKLLSSQYLLVMLYLPSLASISRQDIAGNPGMEPKGTEKLRVIL